MSASELGAWLSHRLILNARAYEVGEPGEILQHACGDALVAPSWLPLSHHAGRAICTIGGADGKEHALVKSAAARLALQLGADEIVLMLDAAPLVAGKSDPALIDLAAAHESEQATVSVGMQLSEAKSRGVKTLLQVAQLSGVRSIYLFSDEPVPQNIPELDCGGFENDCVFAAPVNTTDQVVELLERGFTRLAVPDPGKILAEIK